MKKRILVVDDHVIHRGVLASELMDLGYDVERARNAEEASKKLEKFEPHLLITDLVIRGDRFEIVRWVNSLREHERHRDLPILFVTAYGEDMREQVKGFTKSDILPKPFDWRDVLTKVREMLAS